uniref:Uncharacterized protein n=1 Tax=Myripristis murdjan TaxID=586833 RepID=A0A667WSW7_9TELE
TATLTLSHEPPFLVRLAKLPVVRSACAVLSVLYRDTKCSHPSLQSVCDVLETGVTAIGSVAYGRVSPVIIKLEPQISVANDVACKGLDWLEATFPVLQKPTEQVSFPQPLALLNEVQKNYS